MIARRRRPEPALVPEPRHRRDHARPALDDSASSASAGRCAGALACVRRASSSTACTATSRCWSSCCWPRTSSPRCSTPSRICACSTRSSRFASHYRPLWLGFGALAFDLLLALIGHEPAARAPRPARLARRALGRLRVLAGRRAARPGYRHRRAVGLAAGADRRVRRRRRRRRGGAAPARLARTRGDARRWRSGLVARGAGRRRRLRHRRGRWRGLGARARARPPRC